MNIKYLMAITIASVAMFMTGTISSITQPALAVQPGFCTRFVEDGEQGSACFSGPDSHKDCKQFAEEVGGTKCRIVSKF